MNTTGHEFGNVGAPPVDDRNHRTGRHRSRLGGRQPTRLRLGPGGSLGLLLGMLWGAIVLAPAARADALDEAWHSPPAAARPWVFWYWMKGAFSRAGITADLEAMRDAGIAGAYLMPINDVPDPPLLEPSVRTLTPEWWALLRHAFAEADRLGLKLAMQDCDGFATAGGPWITPDLAMQKVVWSETRVAGGAALTVALPQPETHENYYRDLAVFAVPISADEGVTTATVKPTVTTSWPDTTGQFLVEPVGAQQIRTAEPGWIQYAFAEPFTARSLVLRNWSPNYAGLYHATRLAVAVSDDGVTFRPLTQLEPPRHGWQDWDADYTFALPPTTARFFRFAFDPAGAEPGSEDLDGAKWRARLLLRGLELSSSPRIDNYEAKTAQVWRRPANDSADRVAAGAFVPRSAMIDLSDRLTADGTLTWAAPAGRWLLLRIGHTATGHRNETAGAGMGLEADKLNPAAARAQFDGWFGETIRQVGPELASRVLTMLHVDSWEAGSQNWSPVLRAEFQRRRGYDPMPWLPVMAGVPIESSAAAEQFLADLRQTLSDLTQDNFFGVMAELAHAHGCVFSAEATAPTMMGDGMRHFAAADVPMGEFWLRSPTHDKPNDMHDAISGAHVYGRNVVQAEAFTELRARWDEHPGMLKPLADVNLALGINRFVFHVFTHNPWLDRRPGMTLNGVGLVFQRDQTWWPDVRAFTAYLARCSALLQLGRPAADVAYFTGETLPSRALLPERYRPALPEGYAADSINGDALLRLATVAEGRLVLPGGASYAVLVVADRAHVSPALAAKLDAWAEAGLAILGAEADLPAALRRQGVAPAVEGLPAAWTWTRREFAGQPITFVANPTDDAGEVAATFRDLAGGAVWNPVTGEQTAFNGTLSLPAHGAVFVVAAPAPAARIDGQPLALPLDWSVRWTDPVSTTQFTTAARVPDEWTTSPDPRVRQFSGTATYRTVVTVPAVGPAACLDLGAVDNLARVTVNGVACGVAWTPPYRVDVSPALRAGENVIEVAVTNTWANRLLAEQALPEAERTLWTTVPAAQVPKEPLPAGLKGPVTLEIWP